MLALTGIAKSFGATAALRGVDLRAARGEVCAIVGENGAGKSTLMGVLSGALAADAGEMTLEGKPYRPSGPAEARAAGVAMVHQELSLCPHLTVAENVLLGREATFASPASMEREATAILRAALGDGEQRVPAAARVSDLSPAERQLVEIARAVGQARARVLILDEPTSTLAGDDVARLFALVRKLAAAGTTVLYISHFLEEVSALADRFVVLRDGQTVGAGAVKDTPIDAIVEMMAGKRVAEAASAGARARAEGAVGEVVLAVRGLAGRVKPKEATFELRRGEVLGIAGLVGAGRTELLRAIFGLDPVRSGSVEVLAVAGPKSPCERLSQGVGLLSEDRKGEGLALALSIAENVTLSKLPAFVSPRAQREAASRWIDRLGVRASSPDQPVRALSGGNQQKVALARLLHHDVDVFLLDEPTRGIDVSSKAQIYALVGELAAKGKAILVVSSYLPELFALCDRIAVMSRGRLGAARPAREWDEASILKEATAG